MKVTHIDLYKCQQISTHTHTIEKKKLICIYNIFTILLCILYFHDYKLISVLSFSRCQDVDRLKQLHSVYGAKTMTMGILTTFSQASARLQPMHEHMWVGCLMNGMMLFVKGFFADGCIFFHIFNKTINCSLIHPRIICHKTCSLW